jgi:ribosome-associated heat shock protein Hsp15
LSQRLDKWLVYARFVKHRALATSLIEDGHIRVNKERVSKPSQSVKPQDVLTIAIAGRVKVVRVLGAAERRGPASHAIQLYEELAPAEL